MPYLFDPVVVGHLECEAWASYYRRNWFRFLRYAIRMVHEAFAMRPDRTLRGAWYVLRANQLWAPTDNDPQAARDAMRRFYGLIRHDGGAGFDPARAAELEVDWWRMHRSHQHGELASSVALIDCLSALYGYLYSTEPEQTRPAAVARARAMALSDQWVAAGRRRPDPLLVAQRRALVECYTALRVFIERDGGAPAVSPVPPPTDVTLTP